MTRTSHIVITISLMALLMVTVIGMVRDRKDLRHITADCKAAGGDMVIEGKCYIIAPIDPAMMRHHDAVPQRFIPHKG